MYHYRITKYDPQLRNEDGIFTKNEWISYWDIESIYSGIPFTFTDYIKVENSYVNALLAFTKCLDIPYLNLTNLENPKNNIGPKKHYTDKMIILLNSIQDQTKINIDDIDSLARLILREHIWAKLQYKDILYIHFGYDYYMYIGSKLLCKDAIDNIEQSELFVENFVSPYLPDSTNE